MAFSLHNHCPCHVLSHVRLHTRLSPVSRIFHQHCKSLCAWNFPSCLTFCWRASSFDKQVDSVKEHLTQTQTDAHTRDVLQTEIRKLRRKRAAAGWEVRNKMAHFRENPSERSARGPWNRTKFSVRFSLAGLSLPMWPCASAVWDCRTAASTSALFVSSSVMSSFSRSSSSTASISSSPAAVCSPAPKSRLLRNHRSLPRRVSWLVRKPEKVHFVRRKQRVKGRGKEEKKDDVTNHQVT